jgi:diguanylate cyclase (GGDEF)-like protein/PAS domain S-box-containing protein
MTAKHTRMLLVSAALEDAADAVLVAEADGRVLLANAAFRNRFAAVPPMLTEPSLAALCQDAEMAAQILSFVAGGDSWRGELEMLDAEGAAFPVALDARPIADGAGAARGVVLTIHDITQRRHVQDSLRSSEEMFRQLVEHADIGIFTIDSHGVFRQVNGAAADQFDMPARRILGANVADVMPQPDADTCLQDVRRAIETHQAVRRDVAWNRAGDLRWHSIYVQPPTGSAADVDAVSVFMRDITHQKRTEEQLLHEATHDSLTGLYNRRYFMDRLRGILSSAHRYQYPVSLCVCDVDDFKRVNDTHGHLAGDEVLATVGRIITEELRSDDIAGRYGGDEFWIILPHTEPEVAVLSIERIGSRVEKCRFQDAEGASFSVSATFGIAGVTSERHTEQQILVAADQALYQGKQSGGGRIVLRKD